MNKRLAAFAAALVVLGSLTACGDDGGSAGDGQTIPIGFVSTRSGLYSTYGIPVYNSSKLAVEQLNEAGGVTVDGQKYTFTLEECESRSEDTGAASCANELVKDKGVKIVFGGIATQAPVIMRVTDPAKTIFFSAAGASAAYLKETNYMIATLGTNEWRGEAEMLAVRQLYPDARTVGIVGVNDASWQGIEEYLEAGADKHGLEIVDKALVQTGTTDFSSALTSLKSSNPDVLFMFSSGGEVTSQVIKAANELDVAPVMFGHAASCAEAKAAGIETPYVGNSFIGAHMEAPTDPKVTQLIEDYREFTKSDDIENAYALLWNYDYFFMLADAIEAAGTTTDTDRIMDHLHDLTYEGVAGTITVDENNGGIFGFEMCKLAEGASSPIEYERVEPPKP